MLFEGRFVAGIQSGKISRTYRYWKRPQAKVDGVYHLHRGGAIAVTGIKQIKVGGIRTVDAVAAGFDDLNSFKQYLTKHERPDASLYRVEFNYLGEISKPTPDRSAFSDDDDWQAIRKKLHRKDQGKVGPWTFATLSEIERSPGVASKFLAAELNREQPDLKKDIRKLKQLGLTISLETGYKLSERGAAYLQYVRAHPD